MGKQEFLFCFLTVFFGGALTVFLISKYFKFHWKKVRLKERKYDVWELNKKSYIHYKLPLKLIKYIADVLKSRFTEIISNNTILNSLIP